MKMMINDKKIIMVVTFSLLFSCGEQSKSELITKYIEEKEPDKAADVLAVDDCELDIEACAFLAVGLLQFLSHVETGKSYLVRSANLGYPRAKVVLANFIIEGNYFEKNPRKGIDLLHEAVGLNSSEAMYYLANEFNKGIYIDKNDLVALQLYEKASELGHKYAPFNAGVLHWQIHQDCHKADFYFEKGAEFMNDSKKALKQLRERDPCKSIFQNVTN